MGNVNCCTEAQPSQTDLRALAFDKKIKRAEQEARKRRPTNPASKEDFAMMKVLGIGTFGKVFLVQHKKNGRHFAMKVIKKELVYRTCQDEGVKGKSINPIRIFTILNYLFLLVLLAERDILTMFDHPFIMKLEYAFQDQLNVYMVMELVIGGELFYHLHTQTRKGFEQERAKFYAAQIVLALDHMHKQGVVYRDLKPENILIDSEGYLRITDFGLSKVQQPQKKGIASTPTNKSMETLRRTETFCGTLEYMAPEMMQNKMYSSSVDWFSFGILLFEMLSGINPFKNEKQERIDPDEVAIRIEQILEDEEQLLKKYEDQNIFTPEAYDLLEKLMRFDPDDRLGGREAGVLEIKQHPFFAGIDWELIEKKALVAPWTPTLSNRTTDTSNFDETFTKMSTGDEEVTT